MSQAKRGGSAMLRGVMADLASRPARQLAAGKRAGVVVVLRMFSVEHGKCLGGDTAAHVVAAAAKDTSAQLEVLVMKRTSRVGDAWSGHIALPGGQRDPEDASDQAAAERECLEEVGVALDTRRFQYLGAGHQRPIHRMGRGRKRSDDSNGYAMAPFVYLQLVPEAVPLTLQPTEVAAALWTPLGALGLGRLETFPTPTASRLPTAWQEGAAPWLQWLGAEVFLQNCVSLPYSGQVDETADAVEPVRGSVWGVGPAVALHPLVRPAASSPWSLPMLPLGAWDGPTMHHAPTAVVMRLSGLTLGALSDVAGAALGGGEQGATAPLSWPPARFQGWLPDTLAQAAAGVWEMASYPQHGLHFGRAALAVGCVGAVLLVLVGAIAWLVGLVTPFLLQ